MKPVSKVIAYPLTFEEILFSNRNKAYGAFVLRRNYKKNMIIACIISVALFTLLISLPLFLKKDVPVNTIKPPIGVIDFCSFPVIPTPVREITAEVTNIKPGINTVGFTDPTVVSDNTNIKGNGIPTIDELIKATPASVTRIAQAGGINQTLIFSGTMQPVIPAKTESIAEKEHIWVEKMPEYKGGERSLQSLITANMVYPEIARKAGIQGKVFLSFIIEKDGSVSNVKVVKGIGGGCDEEASRVILMLDKWNPGIQNGSPVRVRMIMPIFFKLN